MNVFKRLVLFILFLAAVSVSALSLHDAAAFQYESKGKRDPFVPLVGAEKPAAARLAEITSVEDIRLQGIVLEAKGGAVAIMNDELIKAGDRVGDILIKSITDTTVTLNIGGKAHELKLPEEGGQKE